METRFYVCVQYMTFLNIFPTKTCTMLIISCRFTIFLLLASLLAQLVKNPPVMWETWVQSLGWEDPTRGLDLSNPWEKGKATHSSILA